MPLLYILIAFVFLLVLMVRFRINAFIALLLSAFVAGVLNGMPLPDVLHSVNKGIGETIGGLLLILTFGAMLGKVLEESGAAHAITITIVNAFGIRNIQAAILLAGFIIGLPMMYNASFLVLIPIVYSFSTVARVPLMQLGIPLSASLSIAHAYLPPHPAPVVVAGMYDADINKIFIIGLVFAVPAIALTGMLMPRFFKHLQNVPPGKLFEPREFSKEQTPPFVTSLLCALSPFLLIAASALITPRWDYAPIKFIGAPEVALFIAVMASMYFLGIRRGRNVEDLMGTLAKAASSIAMIMLIIGAGGAFKQVLGDSGVSDYLRQVTASWTFNPIVMAWCLAAVVRLALGSATIATITAAGIMTPLVKASGVSPELMVLATGSGSLMFSHFNDIGFWMFKEYYNVSIKETFQIWTVMECIVGIVGLVGCLVANHFFQW